MVVPVMFMHGELLHLQLRSVMRGETLKLFTNSVSHHPLTLASMDAHNNYYNSFCQKVIFYLCHSFLHVLIVILYDLENKSLPQRHLHN